MLTGVSKKWQDSRSRSRSDERALLAVGEAAILLHPALPLAGASVWAERGCQHNDRTPAGGWKDPTAVWPSEASSTVRLYSAMNSLLILNARASGTSPGLRLACHSRGRRPDGHFTDVPDVSLLIHPLTRLSSYCAPHLVC